MHNSGSGIYSSTGYCDCCQEAKTLPVAASRKKETSRGEKTGNLSFENDGGKKPPVVCIL
jgi:hypothetical protein